MVRSRATARPRLTASRRRRPQILKLVGPSGVGKTTLAERLIARWTKDGLSVGYVKHAAHGFDLDRPGKDSFRAGAAGARGVCLLGPTSVAYLAAAKRERPEDLVERFFSGSDLVLVEGFSLSSVPALVFQPPLRGRSSGGLSPKPRPRGQVLALIVADRAAARPATGRTPVVGRDDIEGILRIVEARLGLRRKSTGRRARTLR